jgi:tRNA G18 (ribose-2'-O)-methylase SpoU
MGRVARIQVSSSGDDRVAAFRGLPDPELLVRHGLFVAEGRRVVRRLLASERFETRAVMVTPPAADALEDLLRPRPGLPVYVVSQAVMNEVAGFNIHRGCLALGTRPPAQAWRTVTDGARRLIAMERVGDADNVGSIFRNAAALGVEGVLLGPACADPLYRKAIRTSMGAALRLPFATGVPWPEALRACGAAGWAVVALTPAGDAPPLADVVAAIAGRPLVVVLGHEGDGLSDDALEAASHRARIPMAAGVDSVNVATAAAIALYETRR